VRSGPLNRAGCGYCTVARVFLVDGLEYVRGRL